MTIFLFPRLKQSHMLVSMYMAIGSLRLCREDCFIIAICTNEIPFIAVADWYAFASMKVWSF